MKKTITLVALALFASMGIGQAQKTVSVPEVSQDVFTQDGSMMSVKLEFNLGDLRVTGRRAVLLTPAIVHGIDTLRLNTIGVYGRERYIHYERMTNGDGMISAALENGLDETSFRAVEAPKTYSYSALVPFEDWMDGATLCVFRDDFGCCLTLEDHAEKALGKYYGPVDYSPRMYFIRPQGEGEKERHIHRTAWVQFPVDEIVIYPTRFNNPEELNKIRSTVDSVRNDSDITIKRITLKGYASPESPYNHNVYLAKNRTKALKEYVKNMYSFADSLFTTDYVAEDWEGLRAKIAASGMTNRDAILAIIDSPTYKPDAREWKIKQTYKGDYNFMLAEWYPALRRTEYTIEYSIVSYTDTLKIKRLVKEAPQKLSVEEFYIAASASSDDEVGEIWETCVRMYPADEIANANAATSALQRGDLRSAEKYLAKAGNLPEADYSRGVLAVLKDNYAEAGEWFGRAAEAGIDVSEATELLELVKERGRK